MQTLISIQILRGLAALIVVIGHVTHDVSYKLVSPDALPNLDAGQFGVDLFFVISGFVMVYSSERLFGAPGAARTFAFRRVIRIVPLYWLMTTVMLVYVMARGFDASDASPQLAATSYVFVPWSRPSGPIEPLYAVGWTLNFEMFFYALFSVAVLWSRRTAVLGLAAFLIALVACGPLLAGAGVQLEFWTSPIVLEFTLGMLLAALYRENFRIGAWSAVALLLLAGLMLFFFGGGGYRDLGRVVHWGIPAAAILAASLAAQPREGFAIRCLAALGDASYSLYLIHPLVISLARMLAQRGLVDAAAAPWLYVCTVVLASIAAAILLHRRFERPVTEFFKRKIALKAGGLATDAGALEPRP